MVSAERAGKSIECRSALMYLPKNTREQIEFSEIAIDTRQPAWVLHGISDLGSPEEPTTGYNSTCKLEVIKRGMENIPPTLKSGGAEPAAGRQ